jgi:precorrin-6B methylase 2
MIRFFHSPVSSHVNHKTNLARLAGSTAVWTLIGRTLNQLAGLAVRARIMEVKRSVAKATGGRVAAGPFAGLAYPALAAYGSALYPKLLGLYEKELHDVISHDLAFRQVDVVVDLGCAEGYYAIGFARMFPGARVLAYEINEEARTLCAQMARHNGVDARIEIHGAAPAGWEKSFSRDSQALIFCDCEGAERELFDRDIAKTLRNAHLVIELHNTFDHIMTSFADTHEVRLIVSTDDEFKAQACESPLLAGECVAVRKGLVAENRHWTMAWVFLRPKGSATAKERITDVALSLRPFLY